MCIYLGQNSGLTYTSQEHVLPAALGCCTKLDKGMVSDEANKYFSPIERDVIEHSFIQIPRIIKGPGKRGKLSPKYAATSDVVPTKCSGRNGLGYMKGTKGYILSQFIISQENKIQFHWQANSNGNAQEEITKLKEQIASMGEKYVFVKMPQDDENVYIAYFKEKIHIGFHDILSDERVKEIKDMDSVEYTYLLMFVYLSDVRVAEIADEFKRTNLEEAKNIAKILAVQDKIEISDEFIENLDVQIDRPNLSHIQGMKKMVPIISDLCPLIIVNESKVGFITSDVPVVKYNQWFLERGYRHPFGFGHMGCQCFVPLSAKICFCLYDDIVYKNQFGNKGRIRLYDEKDVEELNRLFMLNSYAEIYYRKNEEEWLRKNVGEKVTEEKDEWILGNPQIGYLQKVSRRSVYDVVKLPMFKTNTFFKTSPFPYSDEAGPLRKAVYEKMDEDIKIKLQE